MVIYRIENIRDQGGGYRWLLKKKKERKKIIIIYKYTHLNKHAKLFTLFEVILR